MSVIESHIQRLVGNDQPTVANGIGPNPSGRSHRNLEEPENALKTALGDALAQWIQERGWGAAALGFEGF